MPCSLTGKALASYAGRRRFNPDCGDHLKGFIYDLNAGDKYVPEKSFTL